MTFRAPLDRGYLDSMSLERPNFSAAALLESGEQWHCYVVDVDGNIGVDEKGELARVQIDADTDVWLLGRTVDRVIHCVAWLGSTTPEGAGNIEFVRLTEVGADLPDDQSLIGAQAVALGRWHADTRFCSRCGERVIPTEGGWATLCIGCGHVEYPRTDPAVIVRVTDAQDRILLAHNTAWDDSMMSLPAGFVEAGETPSRTVIREVYEEIGIRVSQVEYIGAQPWPGPRSLMLAFSARIDEPRFVTSSKGVASAMPKEPELRPDGIEIDYAQFFSREEYKEALRSGKVRAPRGTSIANSMLTQWLGESLPHAEDR